MDLNQVELFKRIPAQLPSHLHNFPLSLTIKDVTFLKVLQNSETQS